MKPSRSFSVVTVLALLAQAALAQEKPVAQQIAEAVSALPIPLRADATVLGYRDGNTLVTLREGSNPLICLADDPARENWHVACYHTDLDPFMARGRELRAEGKNRREVHAIRLAEIESGELEMPHQPTALYTLTGPAGSFDPGTGEVCGARGLHVLYVPYATEATIGVSETPSRERPWLMFPGQPWAHIMIPRP